LSRPKLTKNYSSKRRRRRRRRRRKKRKKKKKTAAVSISVTFLCIHRCTIHSIPEDWNWRYFYVISVIFS
jgi:hypothetical protein